MNQEIKPSVLFSKHGMLTNINDTVTFSMLIGNAAISLKQLGCTIFKTVRTVLFETHFRTKY